MGDVKEVTREKLLGIAGKYGKDAAISAAQISLSLHAEDGDFKRNFNGEICETVLEILLREKKEWFYLKGLVLPDVGGGTPEFLTEIDFTVCTQRCVFCIECKSYAGKDKHLRGDGTLYYGGKVRDVYAQNKMHLEVLRKLLDPFANPPVYQMVLFDFSTGNIRDERQQKAKNEFRLTNEKNVIRVLEQIDSISGGVWDMDGLRRARSRLEKFSDENRLRHLEYVKTLHREGR